MALALWIYYNRPPFVVVEIVCRMSDIEEDVVDYSVDLNPYEPIWTCPIDPLEAMTDGVQVSPFPRFSVTPPPRSDLDPSSSSLSFVTLSIDSPSLDCPPLSPATLHLLASCTPPSPLFDLLPLDATPHQVPYDFPSSVGFDIAVRSSHPSSNPFNPFVTKLISTSSPSGCFDTLVVNSQNKSSMRQQEHQSSQDPLQDHLTTPRTGKTFSLALGMHLVPF